jgi:hypothetical protein
MQAILWQILTLENENLNVKGFVFKLPIESKEAQEIEIILLTKSSK